MPSSVEERRKAAPSLRGTLRFVRHLPDRLLHVARRRRALNRVQERKGRPSVLIICHGNICRSPYAEAALRRASARNGIEPIQVDSAGFIGPGRRPPSNAREVARERGIDLDTHVSKVVSPGVVAASDLIVVMDVRQGRAIAQRFEPPQGSILLLGDLDPEPIQRRTILDPINQSEAFFQSVYTRVDRCVSALAEALGTDTEAPKDTDV